jgi:hypothetical protein
LLDWLRVEYGIAKPSNKLLALTELDSNTWVSEVKRIRGKKQRLSSAGLHALTIDTNQPPDFTPYSANTPAPLPPPAPSPSKP